MNRYNKDNHKTQYTAEKLSFQSLKKFASQARKMLIGMIEKQARLYGFSPNNELLSAPEVLLDRQMTEREGSLLGSVSSEVKSKGLARVVEDAAYEWFIRIITIRYMECNALPRYENGIFTNEKQDLDCFDLIEKCNGLHVILPQAFKKLSPAAELFISSEIITVIRLMTSCISIEEMKDNVEIIGWLYQYYTRDKSGDKPIYKTTVKKEDIPAATQLFTNKWVVRYILDNSLGRYWLERNKESSLACKLEFLCGNVCQVDQKVSPQSITVFDPCMGAGHFLVYAFDLLMEIYKEMGWREEDAAVSIIENNIFGLDIDDRVVKIACLAIMLKAAEYNKSIIKNGAKITPRLFATVESEKISSVTIEKFTKDDPIIKAELDALLESMKNAGEYGSAIRINGIALDLLSGRCDEYVKECVTLHQDGYNIVTMIKAAELLTKKYCVVATNPPFLCKMSPMLKGFLTANFKNYCGDLFSVFIYRNFDFCLPEGYSGFMTPFVWMFLKTYRNLRQYIIKNKSITTLCQMEYSAYQDAMVPICAFVLKNGKSRNEGCYFKLSDFKGGMDVQAERVLYAIKNKNCGYYYQTKEENFLKIPGFPIAYWLNHSVFSLFDNPTVGDLATTRLGMTTGDNSRFIRYWFEVDLTRTKFDAKSQEDLDKTGKYWVPYNKGGDFRKWYGNNDFLIYWKNQGNDVKCFRDSATGRIRSTVPNTGYYFLPCTSWSKVSSSKISFRYKEHSIFDVAGACLFSDTHMLDYLTAFLNSKVGEMLLSAISPTMNFEGGHISSLPVIVSNEHKERIESLALENKELARMDWDSFETSYGFKRHPLVRHPCDEPIYISRLYEEWEAECNQRFERLRANEEEINRIFISIYKLDGQLTPLVKDDDVTVRKANLKRELRSLVSYIVGCIFGRYSVDIPGLCAAGGGLNEENYKTVKPCRDNVVTVFPDDTSENGLLGRVLDFIKKVYGEASFEENLRFIAKGLGKGSSPTRVLEKYLLRGFWRDHLKAYSNRPIYWMFSSGKAGGFNCLAYYHRYTPELFEPMLCQYILPRMEEYSAQLKKLKNKKKDGDLSPNIRINGKTEKIRELLAETEEFCKKIHHLSLCGVELDSDNGIKANYQKLKEVVMEIS